jgi:hypothetical protein
MSTVSSYTADLNAVADWPDFFVHSKLEAVDIEAIKAYLTELYTDQADEDIEERAERIDRITAERDRILRMVEENVRDEALSDEELRVMGLSAPTIRDEWRKKWERIQQARNSA